MRCIHRHCGGGIVGWACLLVVVLAGCGETASTASGTVTLDGQPLEKGTIAFLSPDGGTATAEAVITNGAFTLTDIPPGPKTVQIRASKVVGSRPAYGNDPNGPMIQIEESIIPPQYNVQSTLTADLKAGDNPGLKFDLKSKS